MIFEDRETWDTEWFASFKVGGTRKLKLHKDESSSIDVHATVVRLAPTIWMLPNAFMQLLSNAEEGVSC